MILCNACASQATATGDPVHGGKHANEYVFMFDLTHDATGALKISRMHEFCDSAFMARLTASLPAAG
jgi:hypothetical protein